MSNVWESWEGLVSSESPDPLEVIALAGRYQRYLSAVETKAVGAARAAGASWQDIANAAGTTRQSAWEKWRAVSRLTETDPGRFSQEVLLTQQEAQVEMMAWFKERARDKAD